jgi:hypothetical protein
MQYERREKKYDGNVDQKAGPVAGDIAKNGLNHGGLHYERILNPESFFINEY